MAKLRKPKRKSTDAEYYAYMDKLAKAKAKEWKRPEDDTLTEMLNDNTYDYRALLDYNPRDAKRALKRNGHFPDTGKTMYHPTFSNESVYSTNNPQYVGHTDYNPLDIEGGDWVDDHTFRPSLQLAQQYFNADGSLRYMRQDDPEARIVPPKYKDGKGGNLSNAPYFVKQDRYDTNNGMTAMMKARMALAAHFGNPTARRMTNYDTRSYVFKPLEISQEGGEIGNVYVLSYGDLVTPLVLQNKGGDLEFVPEDLIWDKEHGSRSYLQSIKFDREKDATYFGEHYKDVAPMMNLYKTGKSSGMIRMSNKKWKYAE